MTPAVTHPLVSTYLRDLERLLGGIDPGERAEVLAGVHEHLDATLLPGASDDDVRRALAGLGSPQSVADEAYAGRPPLAGTVGSTSRPPLLSRTWVPTVVGLALGLALLASAFVATASAGYSVTTSSGTDAAGNVIEDPPVVEYGGAFPQGAWVALLVTSPLWFPPLLLCLTSALWTSREKTAAALTIPAAAVAVTALPDLGWAVTRTTTGISSGAWSGLALALVGGGYLLLRLSRSGLRRAEALEGGGGR